MDNKIFLLKEEKDLSLRKQNKNDYEKSENHRRKENRVQRPDGKVRKQD